jgi:hypothetical protein
MPYPIKAQHRTHSHHFVNSLSKSQRNHLRVILIANAVDELHHALDIQKSVARAVDVAEHKLAAALEGVTR